jgi:hypothetical protein
LKIKTSVTFDFFALTERSPRTPNDHLRKIVICFTNVQMMWYCVSEGTSHTFGKYVRSYVERSNRTTNIRVTLKSTGMFEHRVPNVRQMANQLILILYDFSTINSPPPSLILCMSAPLSLFYSNESVRDCFG